MEFTQNDIDLLETVLKFYCPVDTGTLKNYGIQSFQISAGNWELVIGIDINVNGRNPSEYAIYTNLKNSTSIGWVDKAIKQWAQMIKNQKEKELNML